MHYGQSCFELCWGKYLAMFRAYSWLCTQESLLEMLRDHMKCQGSYSDIPNARALSTVPLSLQPFLFVCIRVTPDGASGLILVLLLGVTVGSAQGIMCY